MGFSIKELQRILRHAGAVKLVAKALAENDNSKQQIYLGGGWEVLSTLPFKEVTADNTAKRPNFKAKIDLSWLTEDGKFEPASHSQLILYPDYPEIRLSGFLRGCSAAPSENMRPVPKENRGEKNSWDGRVLFFGVTSDRKILSHLSLPNSTLSIEFDALRDSQSITKQGVLYDVPLGIILDTKQSLLDALGEIKRKNWVASVRMNAAGEVICYQAKNGGGYTLEALLGVKPNSIAGPDYLGWEIKAFAGDKVTLMTPEPDGGYYGDNGAEAFLRKYGYKRLDDTIYFTGVHKVNQKQKKTGQTLVLDGFNAQTHKITNIDGGISLIDDVGNNAATWTYRDLITHWGRKHANAAYIPYEMRIEPTINYQYLSPVLLGVGTDFSKFLGAMNLGAVNYDPAPKLTNASEKNSKVKARSQFRISIKNLPTLYDSFVKEEY
jgi:hypothetical protein